VPKMKAEEEGRGREKRSSEEREKSAQKKQEYREGGRPISPSIKPRRRPETLKKLTKEYDSRPEKTFTAN